GQSGYWTVAAEPAGDVLQLQGADLTTLVPLVQSVAIIRIGGDEIDVNGSSEIVVGSTTNNTGMTVAAPINGVDPTGTAARITRTDGKTWDKDSGFAVGQQITITGEWSFPAVTFARNAAGDTITRASGSWLDDGFGAGQTILLSGTTSTNGNLTNNGSFT